MGSAGECAFPLQASRCTECSELAGGKTLLLKTRAKSSAHRPGPTEDSRIRLLGPREITHSVSQVSHRGQDFLAWGREPSFPGPSTARFQASP